MSDMSPSPPLNRRKSHRRAAGGGAGEFHHGTAGRSSRGGDHHPPHHHQHQQLLPPSRIPGRQSSSSTLEGATVAAAIGHNALQYHHRQLHSSATSNSGGASSSNRQQNPNQLQQAPPQISPTSSLAGAGNCSSSTTAKNVVGGGDTSHEEDEEEFSDADVERIGASAAAVAASSRRRRRRNENTNHRVVSSANDEEEDEDDDERERIPPSDDEVAEAELVSAAGLAEKQQQLQLRFGDDDERVASVIGKRVLFPADGGDRFANAHPPPLHNAAAVARSRAVGVPNNPLHNWQATKHTLKERFSFMFCNEILADVHFVVGRGDHRQRIPAHRFVLSVGSAVFDAMFNGAMAHFQAAGGNNNGGGGGDDDIELPDVEPAAFLALLKFLYSDDVQIGPESVMTTLYTAKKYAVPALENACVEFLKRALNADNAFMLLTQARLFDEPHLAALCLEMIDKYTSESLNAESFTDIDTDTLCSVLERDTLRIREVALYQALVRWGSEECRRRNLPLTPENQRSVLIRPLQLIRFPLMTVEEFAQGAAQSNILSDRETVNLFLYFTVNPKPSVVFSDIPRCCITGKEQVINRFQRIEGRWGYSGTPDRIKFNVDRRIYVVGFGLYGSIHGPVEYQVIIQIIHCGTGKVVGSNETSFQCDGSSNTFRVVFKEPVEINPAVTYIASACLKGPDSHYGTKGLRRVVQQSPNGGNVTFQFTYAAGNNNGTSVEDGQIPEIIYHTKLCA